MSMSGLAKFAADAESELFSIDVFGAIRRRKWIGLAIVFVGCCAALAAALAWPPTYQSSATILIEEPDVPDDLVKSTVSTFADDRLQLIQQQVMTTQNLSDIIDRFGLYTDALTKLPRSQVIAGMRENIDLNILSAELQGRQNRSNQPKASIAFTVSFSYRDPRVAQQVVSRLADLYLAESAQSRQAKAAGTTEFMVQQSEKLFGDVQELERRLADLKAKNAGALPEQLNLNIQILSQSQSELMETQRRMNALREKKAFLQNQLAQISPYMPMSAGGQPATPQAQLMALQLQYVDLSAKYGPKHPEVIHLQKQIDSLKSEVGTTTDVPPAQATLSQLQAQLAEALQRYGEQHPTVVRLRQQIDAIEKDLAKAPSAGKVITAPKGPSDNPIYIQLQSQLGDASAELEGLQPQAEALTKKVEDLQARVLQTPSIEGDYYSLQQQYDAAVKRYQDFKDKETEAQVAQNMELQSKSETFSVVEAPQVPDLPIKPNRKLLVAEGAVISIVLAVSIILIIELLDGKIYEPRGLQTVFGQAPLAVVPYISTPREVTNARLRMVAIVLMALGAVAGGLAAIHFMYMPLDVLAAAIINRISI
jgi:uncharacterized protein involved in exopolysaccharide biosynthesis